LFTIPGTSLGIWHTYAQATSDLNTIHNAYPNLTRLMSIGKTVGGRDMWAIEITDNPGVDEDEPEFYYQGSMHGDEPVGMEMSFYFMQNLLENYGTDSRLTNLVSNMDIWIVPNMNWDGYSRTPSAWRYNANGVDLNRDFPEWTSTPGGFGDMLDGPAPSTTGRAIETVNMMNFRRAHHFVASANFHTGSLVVNYPWDTNADGSADFAYTPDDALFRATSLVYSTQNTPMYNNNSFPFVHGTTNGDNWYEVSGGMQDWSYLYTGDNEVTIELNTTKYPAASTLPTLWGQNRESMLQYMEAANWGVRGLVTNINNGTPIAAKITLTSPTPSPTPDSSHPATHAVFSDPALGDFHRQLLPGTYSLKFEAAGYQTQTISNIVVSTKTNDPTQTLRLNVPMTPMDTTPPTVTASNFRYDSGPQALTFNFSESLGNSLTSSDLTLQNLTTGQTLTADQFSLNYNSSTNLATFTFPNLTQGIPDGNWRATLPAGSVADVWGNRTTSDYSIDFYTLGGDANRDRSVDLTDFSTLASNFNTSGRSFSQGNFDYDANGTVDLTDFTILAANFNKSLPASAPSLLAQVDFSGEPRMQLLTSDVSGLID
jgi:hypothetical protein